ncbi:DUF4405 domain-containing protein [Eggerthellaceae bacterium zg-887]|uniref:DUF4405 domain-containing protein n=1 Tax=Xiamenia xianingshaonis TaxID=2682776 RepID=UPI00140E94E2|nr:DUF4405 domain-containing protein [Xiamenia xianingshaonis]NHM16079.1 DUF4405 domain-containing protein [Xiamenia xianingshaonis]
MGKRRIIFDAAMLAVYLAAGNPAITGIPLHEYLGFGAFVVMAVHIALRAGGPPGRGHWGRLALNAVLLVSLAACVVSGVMVSGTVLPAFGLYATGYFFWGPLHALSAKVLLAALLVHLVLRSSTVWTWIRRHRAKVSVVEDVMACEEATAGGA